MSARRDIKAEVDEELRGPAEVSPPLIEPLGIGAGYMASFRQSNTRIQITGLRQGREGFKGDVRIEVGPFSDGDFRLLNAARLELSSMSQRETWERVLRKRWPGCNWDQTLQLFCAAIMEQEKRLDRPAVKLREVQRPVDDGWLIEPVLVGGMPTVWYGDGGTGKSLMALAAAVSLHEHFPVIGRLSPTARRRVLFCNFEPFPEWAHRERMRQLCGLPPDVDPAMLPDLDYLDCQGATIVQQIDRIISSVRQLRSEYLVVDSIGYAAEGPLNDDETARLYYRALGQIGLPSLSTAHQPKNGDQKSIFGSAYWKNGARLVWHFQKADQNRQSELLLMLTNEKGSTTRQLRPLGLSVSFEDNGTKIVTADPSDWFGQSSELWRQLEAVLLREIRPMSYAELALSLGVETNAVRTAVARHPEAFFVERSEADRRVGRVALRALRRPEL